MTDKSVSRTGFFKQKSRALVLEEIFETLHFMTRGVKTSGC